jgi:photosystem II stability/assembly factor-like uncharacterized protein
MHFFNELEGLALGRDNTLIRTEDGGIHWSHTLKNVKVFAMAYIRGKTVVALADERQIFRTTDGGENWDSLVRWSSRLGELSWLEFFSPNTLLVGSKDLVVLVSEDGGKLWDLSSYDLGLKDIEKMRFWDKRHGCFIDNSGDLQCTQDGGKTFTSAELLFETLDILLLNPK